MILTSAMVCKPFPWRRENGLSCSVIPNNWINYILLTLRGVFWYYFNLVLNTPLEAENSTPVSSAFFSSKDFTLCSSGKQKYKTRKWNIAGRLLAVFNHSNKPNPLNKGSHEQTRRRLYHG